MSFVFGNLPRKEQSDSETVIDYEGDTDVIEITDGLSRSAIYVVHDLVLKQQYALFTQSQKFVEQCRKYYILTNPHEFLPYVQFWFKPSYGLQLAVRRIVTLITGFTTHADITNVILSHPYVLKHFKKYLVLNHAVYTGRIFIKNVANEWPKGVIASVLGGLVEVIAMNQREKYHFPMLFPEILSDLGDSSHLISSGSQVQETKPVWVGDRTYKGDVCMLSVDYACIICTQSFGTHDQLLDHVTEHNIFHCKTCGVKCGTYQELAAHGLTFCRSTWLTRICQYCENGGSKCFCLPITLKIYEGVIQWVREKQIQEIFNHNLYSYFLHYYASKCSLQIPERDESLVELVTITKDNTISSDQVETLLIDVLPDSLYFSDCFTIVNWGMEEIQWDNITYWLQDYFFKFEESRQRLFYLWSKQLHICVVEHCSAKATLDHLTSHQICPFSRSFQTIELPIMHVKVDETDFMNHVFSHTIRSTSEKICGFCNEMLQENEVAIKLGSLLKHAQGHSGWEFPSSCSSNKCSIEFTTRAEYLAHLILHHSTDKKQVVTYLNVIWCNVVRQQLGDGLPAAAFKDDFLEKNKLKPVVMQPKAGSQRVSNDSCRCRNELHQAPVTFSTLQEKEAHIKLNHKCPMVDCPFYSEFEYMIKNHYDAEHASAVCKYCNKQVEDLEIHILSHPACNICHSRFLDAVALSKHEGTCTSALLTQSSLMSNKGQNQVALGFLDAMQRLVDNSGVSESDAKLIKFNINNFASESMINKTRARGDLISRRIDFELFFDIPLFHKNPSNQLAKILQSVGQLSEDVKFNADSSTALKDAIQNFELMDTVLKAVDRHVAVGMLDETQSVLILTLYLSQRIYDEVASYLCVTDLKSKKFSTIIASLQFLYVPLRLQVLEKLVLNYRINTKYESFLTFASRVTRHISLCARRHPEAARKEYIESYRCQVFRSNLPVGLLETVDQKESIYSKYNSTELLNIMVSFTENHSPNYEQQDELNKYRVYGIKAANQPEVTKGPLRKPKGNQKKPFQKAVNQTLKGSLQKKTGTGAKLQILKDLGLQLKQGEPVCFLCLGPHYKRDCTVYKPDTTLTEKPCMLKIGTKDFVFGFHDRQVCRHGSQSRYGKEVSKITKAANSVGERQSGKKQTFRPYKQN